ncbi:MAG: glycosyltransferase [Limnochordales bacterium]|nr:glycosyltransferase [Limnochordales bacterium]
MRVSGVNSAKPTVFGVSNVEVKYPIRVLHVIPDLNSGGAERLVTDLCIHGRPFFNSAVCVIYSRGNTSLERELNVEQIPIYSLNKSRRFDDLRLVRRFWQIVGSFRPHVLHFHRGIPRYAAVPSLRRYRGRNVYTIHGDPRVVSTTLSRVTDAVFARLLRTELVGCSKYVADAAREVFKVPQVKVVYNGIDLSRYQSSLRSELRNKLGISEDTFVIVCVANFAPWKNHRLLIESFCQVRCSVRAHLLLIGDGPMRGAIEERVRQLGLEGCVHFLGKRQDVGAMLTSADVFALGSTSEAFSLSIVEAMAAGLPVVATRVGGIPEVVEDGETGFLVDDKFEMAERLIALARNTSLRYQMGLAARNRVQRFDIGRVVAEYAAIYGGLVGAGSS